MRWMIPLFVTALFGASYALAISCAGYEGVDKTVSSKRTTAMTAAQRATAAGPAGPAAVLAEAEDDGTMATLEADCVGDIDYAMDKWFDSNPCDAPCAADDYQTRGRLRYLKGVDQANGVLFFECKRTDTLERYCDKPKESSEGDDGDKSE